MLLLVVCPVLCWARDPACVRDLLPGTRQEVYHAVTPIEAESDVIAAQLPVRFFNAYSNPYSSASSIGTPGTAGAGDKKPAGSKRAEPELNVPANRLGTEKNFFRNLVYDQEQIWTSPFRLKGKDARWLVPFGAITGALIASDARAMQLEQSPATAVSRSNTVANGGLAAFGGLAGGLYLWGRLQRNPHARETGILTAQAMLDGVPVVGFLKVVTSRERPDVGNGRGDFLATGKVLNGSFPSEHAVLAWSAASVIAHEYPGWLTQVLAYGGATAVSIARVSGRQHFPSDVVVGSALGWMIGRQVYRAHHDPDLGGANIGVFTRSAERAPAPIASTYVPLDSWIYPVLLRLAAMGFIDSQTAGMQPWTRLECYRQYMEARSRLSGLDEEPEEAAALIKELGREFTDEQGFAESTRERELVLDSVYFRYTRISGTPLTNSYHFGQTVINDFGRPFSQGNNVVTGFSARAVNGRFSYYMRGEYQHTPSLPPLSLAAREFIASVDGLPLQPARTIEERDRFRVVEAYAGLTLGNFDLTFGKQSLWWGPARGSAMIFSDNAEPLYMFRVTNPHPFRLPGPLALLGDIRGEFFIGKLQGHSFVPRPFIHGQKITIKPTANLEIGFSRTVTFAGAGQSPFTFGTLGTSFFSVGDQIVNPNQPGSDPGDRHGQMDFSYRVPKLRDWLTIYSDSYVDDDPSPLAAPRRAAFNPGFYLSHLPGLPKVDLRAESVYTDVPALNGGGHFIYFNTVYRNGYTSNGNLLGSWIGRQAKGFQVGTTYWHTPRNTFQMGWRNSKISTGFVPGGGTQNDIFGKANILLRGKVSLTAFLQSESWKIPLLAAGTQHNWTGYVQVEVFPRLHLGKRAKEAEPQPLP